VGKNVVVALLWRLVYCCGVCELGVVILGTYVFSETTVYKFHADSVEEAESVFQSFLDGNDGELRVLDCSIDKEW